eukprot:115903-Pleurochrysis_carterae.AAC.1
MAVWVACVYMCIGAGCGWVEKGDFRGCDASWVGFDGCLTRFGCYSMTTNAVEIFMDTAGHGSGYWI